jgi:hypothetical protein
VTASSDAVADVVGSKRDASSGRATLTSLAILALIYQRHVPEPLLGVISIKDSLDYVVLFLGALLLGQQLRLGLRGAQAMAKKVGKAAKAAMTFLKKLDKVRVTFDYEARAAEVAGGHSLDRRGDDQGP